MTIMTYLLNATRTDVKAFLGSTLTHGAIGDDNTTPTTSDTTLGNETFRDARDDFDSTTFSDKVIVSLQVGSGEANSTTVREGGWLDASSSGNLSLHFLLNEFNKTSDIQLFLDSQITITVEEI